MAKTVQVSRKSSPCQALWQVVGTQKSKIETYLLRNQK